MGQVFAMKTVKVGRGTGRLHRWWLLTKVYGHRAVGQNEKKHEVDGRYRPPGEEETEAFHHSSRFARGLHPRPFLTVTPPVPFLPRQPGTKKQKKKKKKYSEMLGERKRKRDLTTRLRGA